MGKIEKERESTCVDSLSFFFNVNYMVCALPMVYVLTEH